MRNTSLRALNVVQCVWVHTVATLLCRDVFRAEVSFFMRDSRDPHVRSGLCCANRPGPRPSGRLLGPAQPTAGLGPYLVQVPIPTVNEPFSH